MSCHSGPNKVKDGLVLSLDAANPKSWSQNVFPSGQDIYTWYVSKRGNNTGNSSTYSQDNSIEKSPANGIPMKMSITGNDPHIGSYNASQWNIATASSGETWKVSVWAKASVNTTGEIYIFGADASGAAWSGTAWFGITNKNITITTAWQRFDHFITFTNASIAYIHMRLDGTNSGGTGIDIWWDGLQVEKVQNSSTLSDFNSVFNENASNWKNLINNPVFTDNSISFDGVDDYVTFEAGTLGSVITVEMLMKINATGNRMPFGFTSYDVYLSGGNLGFNTGASDIYGLTSSQVTELGLVGNWKHYSFVMLNNVNSSTNPYTGNKIYVNGIEQSLSQITGTQSGSTRNFTSGSGVISGWLNSSSYKINMNLVNFKIYNKQLSSDEIRQNFNASRGRYGI